jgi:hypothetical protein
MKSLPDCATCGETVALTAGEGYGVADGGAIRYYCGPECDPDAE